MTAKEYFDNVIPERKEDRETVRSLIKGVFPDAEETMAYELPTYVLNNEAVLSFASQKSYMALYVCSYD